jgi:putative transferase (TIGR04331 family)
MKSIIFSELGLKYINANEGYVSPWVRTKRDIEEAFEEIKVDVFDYKLSSLDQQKIAENFCKDKYFNYITKLSIRLNDCHNVDYDSKFWAKTLNFWLYRNICMTYDKYVALKDIDIEIYHTSTLDKSSFVTPSTCDQSFKLLSSSPRGAEQMVSIYYSLFSRSKPKNFLLKAFNYDSASSGTIANIGEIPYKLKYKLLFKKLFNKKKFINKIKRLILKIIQNFFTVKIIIIDSFFSTATLSRMYLKSFFKIQDISFSQEDDFANSKCDPDIRNKLFKFEEDFDDFDKYFFECMKSLMPMSFIENFNEIYNSIENNDTDITHVISEAWLGNEFLSMRLAIMQKKNIVHIHPQHGWVHPCAINLMWLESLLCDVYLTSGIGMQKLPNIVPGGYVRERQVVDNKNKSNDIVFFSTTSPAYTYQFDENLRDANFVKYLDNQIKFIDLLDKNAFKHFVYRKYPVDYGWGEIDGLMNKFPTLKLDNIHQRGLERLLTSKIVIYDVLSTGYIESIVANIPTIVIFDKGLRALGKEHEKWIDMLNEINVVFYNVEDAAFHLNSIYQDPYEWWDSKKVQGALEIFIKHNAREAAFTENYLLELLK